MNFGPIPIVLAVSGHRDLLEPDEPFLRDALTQEFESLRKQYPHSPLQLLNGMAEGADWLAAQVALDQGIQLIAALPMPLAEYEQDFTTPLAQRRLYALLEQANEVRIVPRADEATLSDGRDAYYQSLGVYLARSTQCLYALWDGNTINPLPGGTADVVRMCSGGLEVPGDILGLPENTQVRHLRCRRQKNPEAFSAAQANTWGDESQEEVKRWQSIFQAIDDFNKAAIHEQLHASKNIEKSRGYLVGNSTYSSALEPSIKVFAIADALAGNSQKKRNVAVILISLLAFTSILFQQLHSGPDMQWYWLALHIAIGLGAFGLYRLLFSSKYGRHENQYLDWRALAEGLRVQIFWQAAGIAEGIYGHYLTSQRDELEWIRQAIRNINQPMAKDEANIDWVTERWLLDQRNYFIGKNTQSGKQSFHRQRHNRWERLSTSCFYAGLLITLGILLSHVLDLSSLAISWLSLGAGIAFVLAAIGTSYSTQMAHKEHANSYGKMGRLFDLAKAKLEKSLRSGDKEKSLLIVKAIGKAALEENSEWLLLHRQRKFEVPK
jgi:hypothetical protein